MFDLFRSRAKAVRYVLGAVLMMVALSMVVTLIPGFGSGGGDRDDQIVAEVGKEVLSARDVQVRVQNVLRGGQVPNSMLAVYVPQIIDEEITARRWSTKPSAWAWRFRKPTWPAPFVRSRPCCTRTASSSGAKSTRRIWRR